MRLSLLYNPLILIERIAIEIKKNKRLNKLKNSPAKHLLPGHIDSLELLEIISKDLRAPIIFDIGANIGTWTLLAKSIFPNSQIHAFEPLQSHVKEFNIYCANLADIYLHIYCAGNENISSKINISSFSDSSSLLDATPLEFKEYNIQKVSEENVTIKRLEDEVLSKSLPVPDIIKLDVQGFELEALKGFGDQLKQSKYIICEVSFKEYYFKQPLFSDIVSYLFKYDYHLFAVGNNCTVGTELNQMDVLFKRIS